MFLPFLTQLRDGGVPVSLREYLSFLDAMRANIATYDVDAFYYLARTTMVKDEKHIDRFDRAFAAAFAGLDNLTSEQILKALDLPDDWLRKMAEKSLKIMGLGSIAGPVMRGQSTVFMRASTV